MYGRYAGYKLLLRMLGRRLGVGSVRGFPPARTAAEKKDLGICALLGGPHDEARGRTHCPCALCTFNRGGTLADGSPAPHVMVADAKECGEGVSFLGVRQLLLADVPMSSEDFLQRIGRAVRFMGHSMLPPDERRVSVRVYASSLRSAPTADQILIERLRDGLGGYLPELQLLKAKAVDTGMWEEEPPAEAVDDDDAIDHAAEVLSETDEEGLAAAAAAEHEAAEASKPKTKPRARAKKAAEVVKSEAPPPPAATAPPLAVVVKEEWEEAAEVKPPLGSSSPHENKENAVQRPKRSPAHASPGLAVSPGRPHTPPPLPPMEHDDEDAHDMVNAADVADTATPAVGKNAKGGTKKAAAVRQTPTRAKKTAAKQKFVRHGRDAKRSEDEDSGSDLDDFIAGSDESSDDSADESSSDDSNDEWKASDKSDASSDADEDAGEESGSDASEVSPNPGERPPQKVAKPKAEPKEEVTHTAELAPAPKTIDSDDDLLVDDEEAEVAPAVFKRLMKKA